jgi:hypothetical protein
VCLYVCLSVAVSVSGGSDEGDLVVPWAAGLEDVGWYKVMLEFECGMPPNGHRKMVANHKDGLRDDG